MMEKGDSTPAASLSGPSETLVSSIVEIRGERVILDADLAAVYGVETKRLNEQVKRNAEKFGEKYVFQLTPEEQESLRSQSATSNTGRGGRRYPPWAFTEYGVVMAATVLDSEKAIEASKFVVDVFVEVKRKLTASESKVMVTAAKTKQMFSPLELSEFGGCSGEANHSHSPVVADLVEAQTKFETDWRMTQAQQNMVARDRKSMLSVPVFAREKKTIETEKDVPVRAILSIDSSTPLKETGWLENSENDAPSVTKRVTDLAIEWSAVVSKLLS